MDDLVQLLLDRKVTVVADVRLNPISRKPGLSKTRLGLKLADAGVRYGHLKALGNARENRDAFATTPTAQERYRTHLATTDAAKALTTLAEWATTDRVAVLCFERDEKDCHRLLVIEAVAAGHDVPVDRAA